MIKIIGIAGGTASGKTTIVQELMETLGDYGQLISQDAYYLPFSQMSLEERKKQNYDHPSSIELERLYKDLLKIREGKDVEIPVYDYVDYTRSENNHLIYAKGIIIVEGLFALYDQEIRELFDLSIYVQADPDERLIRRIGRDMEGRGRSLESVLTQYQETVKPMHEAFIAPTKKYADIILPRGAENRKSVELLKGHLRRMMEEVKK